jgi:hypothetical protein
MEYAHRRPIPVEHPTTVDFISQLSYQQESSPSSGSEYPPIQENQSSTEIKDEQDVASPRPCSMNPLPDSVNGDPQEDVNAFLQLLRHSYNPGTQLSRKVFNDGNIMH